MPPYHFDLFGAPRLEHRDQPVAMDTRKALALLAYLLIEEQPQSRDTLATLLWPESDQSAARAALRRTLSTLRSALGEESIDFGREIIALLPEGDLCCDVLVFRAQLAECRSHGHADDQVCPRCSAPLQQAAELYSADFMAGFSLRDSAEFDDWQFLEADRLRRELMSVLERLVSLYTQQEYLTVAIQTTRRWLALDTLNEIAHRTLMKLFAQDNRRNAALHQYRQCVRILEEELGVPPLEETTQLYEAIKENRLEFALSEAPDLKSDLPDIVEKDSASLNLPSTSLIGRASEWEQLTRTYEGLRQNGVFTALTGEAGIGKTRLAQELIAHLQKNGAITLSARCYAGESNLAFTPLIDLLRQGICQAESLSRTESLGQTEGLGGTEGQNWWQGLHPRWLSEVSLLIPELSTAIPDFSPAPPNDGPGAQTRFYEGVCQVLAALVQGPLPGLIFIDNLEWADESTLDLLAYLGRRLQDRPLFLLLAWQTDAGLLEQVLRDAEGQGYGLRLPLAALSPEQSLELINHLENHEQPFRADFKQELVEASQGLPYFLVEYLQAALEGQIHSDMAANQWPVPAGLRSMLHTRLGSLSSLADQILQAAAVIGRTFESDLLQAVSGRTEEEVILGIEELQNQGFIREVPTQPTSSLGLARFDFKHEQVRTLVLEEISLVRRRLLHRRVADALNEPARLPTQRTQSGQIAYHYQQAGLTEQAAEFYFQAGQTARAVHANADALAQFQAALALGYPQKPEVLLEIGDLHTLNGDYPQAIQQFEAAAAFSSPALLPPIEQKLGRVYLRRGLWEQAACHFEAALYELESVPAEQQKAFEAEIRADWSLACHREGKTKESQSLAQAALTLAETSGDPLALAQAHNLLGVLARADQRPGPALEYLSRSLAFARRLENPSAQIAALNNLALAQADQDQYEQAIATLEGALEECRTLGDRHLEAALRNNLADILRTSDQPEAAIEQLKLAVAIFAEIGADFGQNVEDWEPEIWKLVEW